MPRPNDTKADAFRKAVLVTQAEANLTRLRTVRKRLESLQAAQIRKGVSLAARKATAAQIATIWGAEVKLAQALKAVAS